MASNSRGTNDNQKNKKEKIDFTLDQISQHLAGMTGALSFLFLNQDLFNKLVIIFDDLSIEETASIIKKGLLKTDETLANDTNFVQTCIAELSQIITLYKNISPILKIYQPKEFEMKGGFHARGSSETN